jgi:hypothetical protein
MTTYVTRFNSSDSGAPSIDGNVGSLVNVLDHCLVIGKVYTTANDSAFTDNTTEARLDGGTAFAAFLSGTPATTDRMYIGHSSKFSRAKIDIATAASGGSPTYVWEYWNGSAWTTLSVTDGTTGFTVDGSVTWTNPSDWATTAVNSVTCYWVRVRFTGTLTTSPTINSLSYLGWLIKYSGTNTRAYQQGGGAGLFLSVNDNGPNGTALGKEADVSGFETVSGALTGTGQFPTTTQVSTLLTWRKSTATGATTRSWVMVADHSTLYLFIATGDAAGRYYECFFGDIYSMGGSSDAYRVLIIGAASENSSATRNVGAMNNSITSTTTGNYMPRTYAATGTSIQVGKHGEHVMGNGNQVWAGNVPYPNGPDSAIYLSPVWVNESNGHIRGRMRGIWQFCHAISNYTDLDTNSGTGTFAGKSFLFIKAGSDTNSGYVLETSDTWEVN